VDKRALRTGVIFVTIGSTGSTSRRQDCAVCDNKMHLKSLRLTTSSLQERRSPVKVAAVVGSW
jgi:hypothetical protein